VNIHASKGSEVACQAADVSSGHLVRAEGIRVLTAAARTADSTNFPTGFEQLLTVVEKNETGRHAKKLSRLARNLCPVRCWDCTPRGALIHEAFLEG
jgi:hypothetical protein